MLTAMVMMIIPTDDDDDTGKGGDGDNECVVGIMISPDNCRNGREKERE